MNHVTARFAAMRDAEQKLEWHMSAQHDLQKWKHQARETIGLSASIGLAVGGAAATAAGAAVAAARGLVQGAQTALAELPAPPLMLSLIHI